MPLVPLIAPICCTTSARRMIWSWIVSSIRSISWRSLSIDLSVAIMSPAALRERAIVVAISRGKSTDLGLPVNHGAGDLIGEAGAPQGGQIAHPIRRANGWGAERPQAAALGERERGHKVGFVVAGGAGFLLQRGQGGIDQRRRHAARDQIAPDDIERAAAPGQAGRA